MNAAQHATAARPRREIVLPWQQWNDVCGALIQNAESTSSWIQAESGNLFRARA